MQHFEIFQERMEEMASARCNATFRKPTAGLWGHAPKSQVFKSKFT